MKIIKIISINMRNKIYIKNKNIILGNISYYNKKNNTIISNLNVNKSYRNQGIGTTLLKEVETNALNDSTTEIFNKHSFNLCTWDPLDKPYLIPFYEKRGYKINSSNATRYYDDGDRIYELVKMSKEIVVSPSPKN